TRPLGGLFREWVLNETRRAQGFGPPPPPVFAPPPPPPPPPVQPQAQREPFGHLFQPPMSSGPAQNATQLFQAPPGPPPPSYQPMQPAGAPLAPAPGEFTLMFGAPRPNVAGQGVQPPVPGSPPKGPIAFDLSLNSPVGARSAPPPPPPTPVASDDFANMFGPAPAAPPPPLAPPPPPAFGGFDKMFGQNPIAAPPPAPAPPPPVPKAAAPPVEDD